MIEDKRRKKEREKEKDIDRNNIPAATLEYYNLYGRHKRPITGTSSLSLDQANRIALCRAKFSATDSKQFHPARVRIQFSLSLSLFLSFSLSLSRKRFECFRKLDGRRRGGLGFEWFRQTRVSRRHYLPCHDKFLPSRARTFFPFYLPSFPSIFSLLILPFRLRRIPSVLFLFDLSQFRFFSFLDRRGVVEISNGREIINGGFKFELERCVSLNVTRNEITSIKRPLPCLVQKFRGAKISTIYVGIAVIIYLRGNLGVES